MVEDGRTHEKSIRRFAHVHAAAIGRNFSAFLHACFNQLQHAVAMLAGDKRTHVRLRFAIGGTYFDFARGFDQGGQDCFIRPAHHYCR